jgi:hypothetical protein
MTGAMVSLVGLLCVAVACGSDAVIAPVLDIPALGTPASPFPDEVETLDLVVSRGDQGEILKSQRFRRGEAIELGGVPFSDNLVLQLTGLRNGGTISAYGRSCEFSFLPSDAMATPHIYFAKTFQWAAQKGAVTADRSRGVATADKVGRAVFAGGVNSAGVFVARLEMFDPQQGAFRTLGEMQPRTSASLLQLGNGRLVFGGGADPSGAPLGYFETIDTLAPATSQIGGINDTRLGLVSSAVAALGDGSLAVFGFSLPTANMPVSKVLLVSSQEKVRDLRNLMAQSVPRSFHTATALSDEPGALVLIAGGVDKDGVPVRAADLFSTSREGFAAVKPQMIVARSHHTAIRFGGGVLIVGGIDGAGQPVRAIELFTVDNGFEMQADPLPAGTGVLGISVTRLPDGRVLLAGGKESDTGPALNTAVVLSLDAGSLSVGPTASMATPRAFHQAALLCDGTVLLTGGTALPADPERYNPTFLGRQ